jgi:hypothetical protein
MATIIPDVRNDLDSALGKRAWLRELRSFGGKRTRS